MDADKQQLDKLKDAARELECDDDEQRFRERLGKLIAKSEGGKRPKLQDRDQS